MTEPKWRRNFLFPSQRFVESFDCELNLSKDLDVLKVRTIQSKERHSGLWDAAVVLGAYIFQHKQEFVGKSVIEVSLNFKRKKEHESVRRIFTTNVHSLVNLK